MNEAQQNMMTQTVITGCLWLLEDKGSPELTVNVTSPTDKGVLTINLDSGELFQVKAANAPQDKKHEVVEAIVIGCQWLLQANSCREITIDFELAGRKDKLIVRYIPATKGEG